MRASRVSSRHPDTLPGSRLGKCLLSGVTVELDRVQRSRTVISSRSMVISELFEVHSCGSLPVNHALMSWSCNTVVM
jgi:hypothetical protein